jgi:hypothetical protein
MGAIARARSLYPSFLYDLTWDMFSIVRCWSSPACRGPERGRLFEQVFYRYCDAKGLPLSERAGSRTLNYAYSASGYLHESDGVIATPDINVHIELKHLTQPVAKIDLVSFNQKGLDFLAGENAKVRNKPLFRVLITATPVDTTARIFAVQWGIMLIEPNRLPLLSIQSLATRGNSTSPAVVDRSWVISEVPLIIVPLQERVRQLASALHLGGPMVSGTRIARMLEIQDREGERCWRALDRTDPSWIEDRYDAALGHNVRHEDGQVPSRTDTAVARAIRNESIVN